MTEIFTRLFSLLAVFLMYQLFPATDYFALFVSVLFTHYLLATYYSRKQFYKIGTQKTFWPALAVLFFVGFAAIYYRAEIFIPFICLHIALSEVYMSGETLCVGNKKFWEKTNLLRILFYCALFVTLLRKLPAFKTLPSELLFFGTIGLFLYICTIIFKNRKQLDSTYNKLLVFDLTAVLLLAVVYYADINFTQKELVFYHIATWIIAPTIKFVRGKNISLTKEFIAMNIFFTGVFYFMQNLTGPVLAASIPLWGSVHFILTVASSKLNPQIIAKYFYPSQQS